MSRDAKTFKGNRGQAEGPGDVRGICYSRGERMQYFSTAWSSLHTQMMQKEVFFSPRGMDLASKTMFSPRDTPRRSAELNFTSTRSSYDAPRITTPSEARTNPASACARDCHSGTRSPGGSLPLGHTIFPGGTTLERRYSYLDQRTPRSGGIWNAYHRSPFPPNMPVDDFYDEAHQPVRSVQKNKRGSAVQNAVEESQESQEPSSEPRASFGAGMPMRSPLGARASIGGPSGRGARASIVAQPLEKPAPISEQPA